MAVVLTSKFYQEAEWKNISKVVFTSPNMISPAIAGTRSHILPGEGNLGMWYEDTSEMFRIEDLQQTTSTDFYNFRMKSNSEVILQNNPTYIDVKEANYNGLDKHIQDNSGVEIIGYSDTTWAVDSHTVKLEYTLVQKYLDEIMIDSDDTIIVIEEEQTKTCAYY